MRKKKNYPQLVKHIYHPEITHCLTYKSKLKRYETTSEKTIVTLKQVIRVVHCGYRCPESQCTGKSLMYRSSEADMLSLSDFTFGLDVLLKIGHLRLVEHKIVDEIHLHLLEQFAPGRRPNRVNFEYQKAKKVYSYD